jgi:hypothetical protein
MLGIALVTGIGDRQIHVDGGSEKRLNDTTRLVSGATTIW